MADFTNGCTALINFFIVKTPKSYRRCYNIIALMTPLIYTEQKIMNRKWTEKDLQYIRENAENLKDRELATELSKASGRTVSLGAVRKMRQRLGIGKRSGRGVCGLKVDISHTGS